MSLLGYTPLALALVAGLAGPLAYSLDTVSSTHTGSLPSAGPTVTGSFGGGGAPGGRGFGGTGTGARTGTGAGTGTGTRPGGSTAAGGPPTGTTGNAPNGTTGNAPTGGTGTGATGTGAPRGFTGEGMGVGGLSGNTQVSSALIKLLEQDAAKYKWIAATEGSQSAAPIELATGGDAVMAVGGFNGTDPDPTLAEFEAMVAKGEIHYYVGESANSFGGGNGSSKIASWVAAHFKSETVGSVTVYNLTQSK